MGGSWLAVPREWLATLGELVRFCSRVVAEVLTLKVLRFLGEGLRQAGLLILSSTLVIWGLAFIIGLQCGIEGAYFNRSVGSPAWRSASPKKRSTLSVKTSATMREQKRTISPIVESHSRGTASQDPPI